MKKYITLGISLVVAGAQAEVTLSNPLSVPTENVALSQLNSLGSSIVQARNRVADLSDWRAITQTFQWEGVDAFDGIGLHMGVGNDSYWTPTSTQTYQLVIQALDANVPTETVLNAEFQLTGDKVADGQWLYIDTDDVDLLDGQWYGFSLAPSETAVNAGLRTLWNTASSNANAGIARQYAPNASTLYIPKEDTYATGGAVNDYAFYMLHAPTSVFLSNPSNAPTHNVVVSQTNTSGSAIVQARNRGANGIDWRGISQTFQWTATNALDGVGLYMGAGNDTYWSGTSTQVYALIIQALDNNTPTATVANIEFYLTGDKVADGQWLYLDIPDVGLQDNQTYGFTLCPPANAVDVGLRTFWATASDNAYPEGIAHQFDPSEIGLPITGSYTNGGPVNDFSFYLVQSVDEGAAPAATILGWSAVSGNLMEMVVAVPGAPSLYHPESRVDLAFGTWTNVAHSIDGNDPFVVTNLGYSSASGDDRVIYVKAEDGKKFYKVIGVPQ